MFSKSVHILTVALSLTSCGPGWDGYEDQYSVPGEVRAEPWEGDQLVRISLEDRTLETPLLGSSTLDFEGVAAVSLSELVEKSSLTDTPEAYRYDFTATDGYNLLTKRNNDVTLLPSWEEMQHGFLYLDGSTGDLKAGWTQHPWGSALSAYLVKYMNGGEIRLLPSP